MRFDFSNFLISFSSFEGIDLWSSRMLLRIIEEDWGISFFLYRLDNAFRGNSISSLPWMTYLIWPKILFSIFECIISYSSSSKSKLVYTNTLWVIHYRIESWFYFFLSSIWWTIESTQFFSNPSSKNQTGGTSNLWMVLELLLLGKRTWLI